MATEKDCAEALARLDEDVPGVVAAAVVNVVSGHTLAACGRRPAVEAAAARADHRLIVLQKLRTLAELKLGIALEDVLLMEGAHLTLIRIVPGSPLFIHVVLARAGANLALLRAALNRHSPRLAPAGPLRLLPSVLGPRTDVGAA